MKTIEIENLNSVKVDGKDAGKLVDVVWNHPNASQLHLVQQAVDAYVARERQSHTKAMNDAAAEMEAEHEKALVRVTEEANTQKVAAAEALKQASEQVKGSYDKAASEAAKAKASLEAENGKLRDEVQRLTKVLGGTDAAKRLALKQRIAALRKAQEEAGAELASIAS